jgi:hypothetical protein
MLDRRSPTHRTVDSGHLLASGRLSDTFVGRGCQGITWNRGRVDGKGLAANRLKAGWRPSKGRRIAEIGPLPVVVGEEYSAQYDFESRHDIIPPQSRGSRGLVYLGRRNLAGDPRAQVRWTRRRRTVIVPGGPPMFLTATGADQRRALVLILHQAAKPPAGPRLDAEGSVQVARAKCSK